MKNHVLFVLLFLSCLPGLLIAQEAHEKGSVYCSQKKMNSSINYSPDEIAANIPHSYNVLNYELNLNIYSCFISPFPKSFSGYEILTFQVDSTLNSIRMNAVNSSLTIDSVSMAGVSFTHSGNI